MVLCITITQSFCCNFEISSKQAQVLCQRPVSLRVLLSCSWSPLYLESSGFGVIAPNSPITSVNKFVIYLLRVLQLFLQPLVFLSVLLLPYVAVHWDRHIYHACSLLRLSTTTMSGWLNNKCLELEVPEDHSSVISNHLSCLKIMTYCYRCTGGSW